MTEKLKSVKTPEQIAAQVGRITTMLAGRIEQLDGAVGSGSAGETHKDVRISGPDDKAVNIHMFTRRDGNGNVAHRWINATETAGLAQHNNQLESGSAVEIGKPRKYDSIDTSARTDHWEIAQSNKLLQGETAWVSDAGTNDVYVGVKDGTKSDYSVTGNLIGATPEASHVDQTNSSMAGALGKMRGQVVAAEIAQANQAQQQPPQPR